MTTPHWIELDGAENVRDLGGLPTRDGRAAPSGRLIRSDSLQQLSEADVRRLVDELDVRVIVDLRTGVEVRAEGPGPMERETSVRRLHLSLFPERDEDEDDNERGDEGADGATPTVQDTGDGPVVLPWQERDRQAGEDERRRGAAGIYERYLSERADSILDALRTIAHSDGAAIVHCAAGKDRTGVVVALALAEVGVTPEAIVADYAASAERIEAIFERLRSSSTYADDLDEDIDKHTPKAATMEQLFAAMDRQHGGVAAWLRERGWTEDDAQALRDKLLGATVSSGTG